MNKNIKFHIPTIKLKDIARLSLGIKTSNDKKFILKEKIDENCYNLLRGRNIDRYYNDEPKEFLWYMPKLMLEKKGAGVRKLCYFLTDKILIQEVSKKIIATYDESKCLVNDTINVIYQVSKDYKMKFILSLLNSKLINFWYKNTFSTGLHIKINQLGQIPIAKTTLEIQNKFIINVDIMLNLNQTFQTKKQKFLNRLQSNFDIEKLSKKIENFYESDFKTLLKELKKKKIILTLKEQDEWEEYFESYKKELLEIKAQIDKTDREIDAMVYELYGLSDEEIAVVEGK